MRTFLIPLLGMLIPIGSLQADDQQDPLLVSMPQWVQVSDHPKTFTFSGRAVWISLFPTITDLPVVRDAIVDRLRMAKVLDQVVIATPPPPPGRRRSARSSVCIGDRVPRAIAQAVLAACRSSFKDPLVVSVAREPGVSQSVSIGFATMGPVLTGEASIAALLDPALTDARFAALLPHEAAMPAYAEPAKRGLLAGYACDGSAANRVAAGTPLLLERKAAFVDQALAVGDGPSSSASASVKELDYLDFTVSWEFNAADFTGVQRGIGRDVLISCGPGFRWFGLFREADGTLSLAFNNGDEFLRLEGTRIDKQAWHAVTCGVELKKHRATVWLDGVALPALELPAALSFQVLERAERDDEQVVLFTDHGLGLTFHGLVDNLLIFNGQLAEQDVKALHAKARFAGQKPAVGTANGNGF